MTAADVIQPSASTASVGKGIRYLGEHCYAYSGTFGNLSTTQTLLDFTSGSGYIVGKFVFNGAVRFAYANNGAITGWQLSFNDLVVVLCKTESVDGDTPMQAFQKVIIPPLTHVVLQVDSEEDNAAELLTATFAGRVYGAE